MEIVIAVIVSALISGMFVYWVFAARSDSRTAAKIARLQTEKQAAEQQLDLVRQTSAERITEYRLRLEKAESDASSRRDDDRERQQETTQVLTALAPVAEQLGSLERRLVSLEGVRQEQYGIISEQLQSVFNSEERLQASTLALEGALKSSNSRGTWGEAQLRNLVEVAGLVEHVDFVTQGRVVDRQGKTRRPDMLLRMPGGKEIPVDAKVPFSSFIKAQEYPEQGNEEQQSARSILLDEHSKALRAHVDELAKRDYARALKGTPDFTVAFIPSEGLLSAALKQDSMLLDYAFRKHVALASPVSFWSLLKTVAFAWQQDALTQDAAEVYDLSRELYERLKTLADHTNGLGKDLGRAVTSYNRFVASLERRVLVSARKLSKLDRNTDIPDVDPVDVLPRAINE